MKINDQAIGQSHAEAESSAGDAPLILPLEALDQTDRFIGGGKAANLGELIQAGFAVPDGFCVTTQAYRLASNSNPALAPILQELAELNQGSQDRLEELARKVQSAWENMEVPPHLITAITRAYQELSKGEVVSEGESVRVAVRSSATAEDLPSASFAGQQDTYLNIGEIEAVLASVKRCWASLWTERAIIYRANLNLDPRQVFLAVVVQKMVDAQVAGVLFTANPLTGKRHQAVIDASPGLGEAVVSGRVNPDHFVVNMGATSTSTTTTNPTATSAISPNNSNAPTGKLVEHRPGDKRFNLPPISSSDEGTTSRSTRAEDIGRAKLEYCLSEAEVLTLAELGSRIEEHFGTPQDIEWAIDAEGQVWLLQARPITSLFPLPASAPLTEKDLRVYLSFNIQQGTYRPTTPMGISATRLLASVLVRLAGFPPKDPLAGPGFVTEAASRIFIDVTPALRRSFSRKFLAQAMSQAEVHAATIFEQLWLNPQLSILPTPRFTLVRTILLVLIRTGMPWHLLRTLVSPRQATNQLQNFIDNLRTTTNLGDRPGVKGAGEDKSEGEDNKSGSARLTAVEQLLAEEIPLLLSNASPVMLSGMLTFALSGKLLGKLATEGELQLVLRGAPSNPTTEMTLALWVIAQEVKADSTTTHLVQSTPSMRLAELYRQQSLPYHLQQRMAGFLKSYGHRSVAELDLGQARWSEDPTYLFEMLTNYLRQTGETALSPEVQFRQAAAEAEEMIKELTNRAKALSRWRGLLVGFCLRRAHALGGLREMPRFCLSLLLAGAREILWPVGEELTRAGRLEKAEDIFFITLPEARKGLAGLDLREAVKRRRGTFEQEGRRRQVPLVLLSDGTVPVVRAEVDPTGQAILHGTAASPGIVKGTARVILEPEGSNLEPGEILVAPSTDPGWTPLFLSAGGLVMELGGAMSHGAIVAREYGIPAVVAVSGATAHIKTGQHVTIDGSSGIVILLS